MARMAKLADARDLKSRVLNRTYRFNSGPGHHELQPFVSLRFVCSLRRAAFLKVLSTGNGLKRA